MGQYYTPVLKNEKGETEFFNMQNEGLKITEHSWIENKSCMAISNKLINNKLYIGWIGDYAEKETIKEKGFKNVKKAKETTIKNFEGESLKDMAYVLNHTKKEYLDIKEYIEKSKIEIKSFKKPMTIFPISILTVITDDLKAGGDYCGINEEYVGYWAGDLLEIKNEKPDEYRKLDICFKILL